MSRRQPLGHVAEEGGDLGLDPRVQIDLLRGLQGLGPRLLLHLQATAQGLRQGGQRAGRGLGQDAGALTAACHQHLDGCVVGGGDVSAVEQGADFGAHRRTDDVRPALHPGRRPLQRRKGRGDLVHIGRQNTVGAAQDRVLLMDHGRALRRHRRHQRGRRGIAAEAHHDIGAQPIERRPRLHHPLEDRHTRLDQAQRPRACRRIQRQPFLGRKVLGVLLAPVIGGQHHPPAPRRHLARQGLGREHMAAGAAGGDDAELGHGAGAPKKESLNSALRLKSRLRGVKNTV